MIQTTIIFVSHDLPEVFKLADEVLVIEEGRFTKRGAPADVFADQKVDIMGEFLSINEGKVQVLVDGKIVSIELPN